MTGVLIRRGNQDTVVHRGSWMITHKLESRLLGEIPTTSGIQMIPLKWQKAKRN